VIKIIRDVGKKVAAQASLHDVVNDPSGKDVGFCLSQQLDDHVSLPLALHLAFNSMHTGNELRSALINRKPSNICAIGFDKMAGSFPFEEQWLQLAIKINQLLAMVLSDRIDERRVDYMTLRCDVC